MTPLVNKPQSQYGIDGWIERVSAVEHLRQHRLTAVVHLNLLLTTLQVILAPSQVTQQGYII